MKNLDPAMGHCHKINGTLPLRLCNTRMNVSDCGFNIYLHNMPAQTFFLAGRVALNTLLELISTNPVSQVLSSLLTMAMFQGMI